MSGLITVSQIEAATMTELAELRAKRGFCPKCQAQKLRYISRCSGMMFRQCAECGTVVVLAYIALPDDTTSPA